MRQQIAPDDFVPDSLLEEDDNGFFNLNIFKKQTPRDSITKKESFLKQVFEPNPNTKDTTQKTPRELRKERREQRRKR